MTRKRYMTITAAIGMIFLLVNLAVGTNPFPAACYFIGLIIGVAVAPEK